jgi:hypothetical protein
MGKANKRSAIYFMVNRFLPDPAAIPAQTGVGGPIARGASRQQNIPSLVRMNGAAEAGACFGKTFVNDREQRPWRERSAQAARGAEFERHAQKIRRR